MAAGLPIVNTALRTAVPTITRHGLEAVTVPPNNAPAVATALQQLLDNKVMASRLGQSGQLRARNIYSLGAYRSRMGRIYEEVLLQGKNTVQS